MSLPRGFRVATLEETIRYGRSGCFDRKLAPAIAGGSQAGGLSVPGAWKAESIGAASQGASGSAPTPAFGRTTALGNLLVCWIVVAGGVPGASLPTPSSTATWINAGTVTGGTTTWAAIYVAKSLGSDPTPTIVNPVASARNTAMLGEFSRIWDPSALPTFQDLGASSSQTSSFVSPLTVAFNTGQLLTPQELILYAFSTRPSAAATVTNAVASTQGTPVDSNNNSTSIQAHYNLGYFIATGVSPNVTCTFATASTTSICGLFESILIQRRQLPNVISPSVFSAAM